MPDDNTTSTPVMPLVDSSAPVLPTVSAPDPAAPADPNIPPDTMPDPVPQPAAPDPTPQSTMPLPDPALVAPPPAAPTSNPAAAAAPDLDSAINDAVATNSAPAPTEQEAPVSGEAIYTEVASKIRDAQNVLIALSSDPSVDEMAAAIGLSLYLDRLGKRATAIYSGATPNALEFLKPEETFEPSADTLQDFVIALNKDKADHLRYKLDGDYVKIYITPYKTRISEQDLEYSYGDFNVDLVIALDVANGIDLDSALREHGRIMHDAVIINVTTGNPGKFGEIEWSEKTASSVSEMIAKLLYSVSSDVKIEKEEATAFLTGIVAATNRFSNASTTPETMRVASKLMDSGANQQLVSKNITPDVENEMFASLGTPQSHKGDGDPTKLDIEHPAGEKPAKKSSDAETTDEAPAKETANPKSNDKSQDDGKEISASITEKESTLLDDLKAAEASLSQAGAETMVETGKSPVKLDDSSQVSTPEESQEELQSASPEELKDEPTQTPQAEPAPEEITPPPMSEPAPFTPEPGVDATTAALVPEEPTATEPGYLEEHDTEKVIQPPTSDTEFSDTSGENKYGHMLEEALNEAGIPSDNPATAGAPAVPTAPEINGVPEMNYMPMPGEEVLPPPPTPPIDMSSPVPSPAPNPVPNAAEPAPVDLSNVAPIQPAAPAEEASHKSIGSVDTQDEVYTTPPANDPSAFKIPGM